jgi:hypothetical protein
MPPRITGAAAGSEASSAVPPHMSMTCEARRAWWDAYFESEDPDVLRARPNAMYCCPACGYPTLSRRADYQICGLCDWQDDGQDDPEPGVSGGSNGECSLAEARHNWEARRSMYAQGPPRAHVEECLAVFDHRMTLDLRITKPSLMPGASYEGSDGRGR